MRRIDRSAPGPGARVRDRRARRRGAQPRVRRRDGAAARRRYCSFARGARRVVPVRHRRHRLRGRRRRRGARRRERRARSAAGRCGSCASNSGGRPSCSRATRSRRATRPATPPTIPPTSRSITRDSYLDDWMRVVGELEPEYGVPFGSMVAFLHPESRHVNRFLVPPGEVVCTWEAAPSRSRGRAPCRWTRATAGAAPAASTGATSTGMRTASAGSTPWRPPCSRSSTPRPSAEAGVTLDFATFAAYFEGFMAACPPGVLGRRRAPPSGGVRGAVVAPAVLGARLRRGGRLPAVVTAARRCERRAGQRGGARRRHRQAAGARRTRVDAHRGAPEGWAARATTSCSGPCSCRGSSAISPLQRSVGTRLARGRLAAPQRVARVGRRPAHRRLRLPLRAPLRPVHHQPRRKPRTGVEVGQLLAHFDAGS